MPPSPRTLARAASMAVATLCLAGCSFLVDFVTKASPDACDGADCLDATTVDGETIDGADGGVLLDAPAEKSPNDVHVEVAQCPNPCKLRDNGWYCGNNGLFCNAPADDLYYCKADAVGDVTHCTDCVPLPNGHPDTCDPCIGKADGTYCGKDLPGVPHVVGVDRNDIYLFDCKGGLTSTASTACPSTCTGAPPNGKCG